ncbi:MAG: hypothetical protein L6243_01935 [Candidatus Altiarchaeales archaeon]|nr:hypothetical protein [Candidatus Altiarchaeota archaeon]MCG2782330.1 hypothetical protein [Candidatus Altiarchaeales archaeon]
MENKSIFLKAMGDYPSMRVLDFLMENYVFDYSKTQIAEQAEVSFNTLESFWNKLIEFGIIERTRKVGRSEMYKLNRENQMVKKLVEIDIWLSKNYADSILAEEKVPIFS